MIKKIVSFFKNHLILTKVLGFIFLFILIWVLYDIFVPLSNTGTDSHQTIRTLMIIAPVICLAIGCCLKGKGTLKVETLAFLIMIAGFSMRIGYSFYTGGDCRQHDVEMYKGTLLGTYENGGQGHFAYITYIYSHGSLPPEIKWQFYHPPLWHMTVALFMKIYSIFEGVNDLAVLFNAGMILSSFVACLTLYGCKKLIFEIIPNDKGKIITFLLIAFHSQFFIMAGWMNNEGFAFMFMIFSLYFAIRYHKTNSWNNIILSSLMLGLSMMSKISGAIVCVPLAAIFIYDLIRNIKDKKTSRTIMQFFVFLLICAPLGLWFQIRNIVQFGLSSIGVPGISTSSSLSVTSYSLWQRFGFFNPLNIKEDIFCILRPNENGYLDYNVWLYTLKCSVFGEYSYWGGYFFACILLLSNAILILYVIYCIVDVLIREWKQDGKLMNLLMILIIFTSLVSYIFFQITNPVTCTQDFRYMTLILIPSLYFVGKEYEVKKDNKLSARNIVLIVIVTLFISASFLTFISVR